MRRCKRARVSLASAVWVRRGGDGRVVLAKPARGFAAIRLRVTAARVESDGGAATRGRSYTMTAETLAPTRPSIDPAWFGERFKECVTAGSVVHGVVFV